ncbi:MAG: extracellular solute-binding protein, partial [Clostridia bacterium]|nr:extracellular solute-binding protein [Clostridia bacterium]
AVASGDKRNYFDVGICANSGLLNSVYANIATPMDDYIYYDDPVWKYSEAADFNCLDLYKINDHFWGAPSHGFHENFIFYNKTYFEEMQAPDPYTEYYLKDNWTFETFMDTCEAVTKKRADGSVEVAAWATWNYFTFLSAAGNDMIAQNPDDPERWEIVYDQPNGMAGLNLLYECAKNGWLNTKTSGYEDFVNRKIAMLIEKPSSAMGSTDAYIRMSDEIGMIPFPKMNKEQEDYICPMIVSGYYIPACAQNPAGAAAYIYYHRVGEQMRDKSEWGIENIRTQFLDEEAQQRRDEYIAKCKFAVPWVDGLAGWYSDNRVKFLNIMWEGTNPAAAADQMKPLLNDSLRRTVG